MHFPDKIKVKVNKDTQMVTLSIRVNETVVTVYEFTLAEFQLMVAQYHQQEEE